MRRAIALLLVVLGAIWLVGTAGATGEPPFGGPTMTDDWGLGPPDGWRRHVAADGSLAIWLPPDWRLASIDPNTSGQHVLAASGPMGIAEPRTTLRVARYELKRKWTIDELRRTSHERVMKDPALRGEVRSWLQPIAWRAASALRFDYESLSNGRARGKLEYAFLVRASGYVVSFWAEGETLDRVRGTLEQIASSFRPRA